MNFGHIVLFVQAILGGKNLIFLVVDDVLLMVGFLLLLLVLMVLVVVVYSLDGILVDY